jgi:hypothetical protein
MIYFSVLDNFFRDAIYQRNKKEKFKAMKVITLLITPTQILGSIY